MKWSQYSVHVNLLQDVFGLQAVKVKIAIS